VIVSYGEDGEPVSVEFLHASTRQLIQPGEVSVTVQTDAAGRNQRGIYNIEPFKKGRCSVVTKERLIREIERLPEELVEEAYDFIAFMRKRMESRGRNTGSWSDFSLGTKSFEFWNDPEEVEYSLTNLKRL